MDKHERSMYRPIPDGHVRVKEGKIQPDDLCLSVYQGVWVRADSPLWLSPATQAEDAFMVARPLTSEALSIVDRIYGGWSL